jgi:hypothetical protein
MLVYKPQRVGWIEERNPAKSLIERLMLGYAFLLGRNS